MNDKIQQWNSYTHHCPIKGETVRNTLSDRVTVGYTLSDFLRFCFYTLLYFDIFSEVNLSGEKQFVQEHCLPCFGPLSRDKVAPERSTHVFQ